LFAWEKEVAFAVLAHGLVLPVNSQSKNILIISVSYNFTKSLCAGVRELAQAVEPKYSLMLGKSLCSDVREFGQAVERKPLPLMLTKSLCSGV